MQNAEHPVWSILCKEAYVEKFHPKAEEMYDFIKQLVEACGDVIQDGKAIPAMKRFFDMWNNYSSETFWILDRLVNQTCDQESKTQE